MPDRHAIAARPRAGDWIAGEMRAWRAASITIVASMLEPEEQRELDLAAEREAAIAAGMEFVAFPAPDRAAPASRQATAATARRILDCTDGGGGAVSHCRAGLGRSALLAACVLISRGVGPDEARDLLDRARRERTARP